MSGLRPEKRFRDADELMAQMKKDVENALPVLGRQSL